MTNLWDIRNATELPRQDVKSDFDPAAMRAYISTRFAEGALNAADAVICTTNGTALLLSLKDLADSKKGNASLSFYLGYMANLIYSLGRLGLAIHSGDEHMITDQIMNCRVKFPEYYENLDTKSDMGYGMQGLGPRKAFEMLHTHEEPKHIFVAMNYLVTYEKTCLASCLYPNGASNSFICDVISSLLSPHDKTLPEPSFEEFLKETKPRYLNDSQVKSDYDKIVEIHKFTVHRNEEYYGQILDGFMERPKAVNPKLAKKLKGDVHDMAKLDVSFERTLPDLAPLYSQ